MGAFFAHEGEQLRGQIDAIQETLGALTVEFEARNFESVADLLVNTREIVDARQLRVTPSEFGQKNAPVR